jgi:hypothetical protein
LVNGLGEDFDAEDAGEPLADLVAVLDQPDAETETDGGAKSPTTMPCPTKTLMIWPVRAPKALRMPISRVFCTVTVMRVFMIPKAATITMKSRMKNITLRSMWMASKSSRFISIQVETPKAGSMRPSMRARTAAAS